MMNLEKIHSHSEYERQLELDRLLEDKHLRLLVISI